MVTPPDVILAHTGFGRRMTQQLETRLPESACISLTIQDETSDIAAHGTTAVHDEKGKVLRCKNVVAFRRPRCNTA